MISQGVSNSWHSHTHFGFLVLGWLVNSKPFELWPLVIVVIVEILRDSLSTLFTCYGFHKQVFIIYSTTVTGCSNKSYILMKKFVSTLRTPGFSANIYPTSTECLLLSRYIIGMWKRNVFPPNNKHHMSQVFIKYLPVLQSRPKRRSLRWSSVFLSRSTSTIPAGSSMSPSPSCHLYSAVNVIFITS